MNIEKIRSILLIDDDKATNFLHKICLKEWGRVEKIYTALNGREGINFLRSNTDFHKEKPSLILLDINMPVMNGFEFMEEYATLPEEMKASILVVMLTSSLHHQDQEKAQEIKELRGFINKPLTNEQMENIMEKIDTLKVANGS